MMTRNRKPVVHRKPGLRPRWRWRCLWRPGWISINYSGTVLQRRGPHVSFTTPSPSRFDCALVVRFSLPPDPISEGPSGGDRPSLASTTISALPSAMSTFTSPLHQSLGDHPSAFPNQYGKTPSLPTRYLLSHSPFLLSCTIRLLTPKQRHLYSKHSGAMTCAFLRCRIALAALVTLGATLAQKPSEGHFFFQWPQTISQCEVRERRERSRQSFRPGDDQQQVVNLIWNDAMPPFSAWVL
jgi:hypothetical protein